MTGYPESLDVRPLTTWPGELTPPHRRQRSPFSSTMTSTLEVLTRELSALGARTPVLEVAIEPGGFRIDGRPRATAKAEHPGVVLSLPFTSVGPLRYATDRFVTWQDNLRAIVLGLEALRRVERYGITRRGEQYEGFKALPPSGIPMPGPMTEDAALRLLGELAELSTPLLTATPEVLDTLYRRAAKLHHPDAGGSTARFQQLQAAMRVLRGER